MDNNGSHSTWFAERQVRGIGEDGATELVSIWIERRPGAVWAVGRALDLESRADGQVREDDYLFQGYEMGDALAAANEALRSDLEISRGDGIEQDVAEFGEDELKAPLERWFFGRAVR